MAVPLYANNVAGLIAVTLGPSDVLIQLGPGQGASFPTIVGGDYYYATIVHATLGIVEIVKVTGKSADVLTVLRAQDGTTAGSFSSGSVVELRVTAQVLRELDFRSYFAQPSGLATLDATGKLVQSQIPVNIPLLTAGKLDIAVIPDAVALDADLAGKANKAGETFTGPIIIAPPGVAVALTPLSITGDFTGPGRLYTFTNTNTGTDSLVGIVLKAGASQGSSFGDAAPTYGGIPDFANKWFVENNNVNGGIGYSAKEITGTHKWYVGYDGGTNLRYLRMTLDKDQLTIAGHLATNNVNCAILYATGEIRANTFTTAQNFASLTAAVVLGPINPGTVYFRPNGVNSAVNEASISAAGLFSAIDVQSTSDRELKNLHGHLDVREDLVDLVALWCWDWKESGAAGRGPVAQEVQEYAPEFVGKAANGYLSIDKAGLALAALPGISARLRRIEAALNIEVPKPCSLVN